MKYTCHSEYKTIKSIFLKQAEDAFMHQQKISSEWKTLNFLSEPDFDKAKEEYRAFEALIQKTATEIHYFPRHEDVSIDSIYCRDASIATDFGIILCNMGKPARKAEPQTSQAAYEKVGIKILGAIQVPGTVEGGDVTWLDETTLAIGHTYRTNAHGIEQIKNLLVPKGINVLTVDLPHYKGPSDVFHLMSIFSPVDKNLAVVYSPLMPIAFRNELLSRGIELVEVPEDEFEGMGCNVLALSPRVCVVVKGNSKTKRWLEKAGCTVMEYVGTEISVKGGGGPTCLTRPLARVG